WFEDIPDYIDRPCRAKSSQLACRRSSAKCNHQSGSDIRNMIAYIASVRKNHISSHHSEDGGGKCLLTKAAAINMIC
ncbi:hypothetical protein ACUWCL_29420, partial [Klebsiella pneumoniae]|uniref:hypothetical protein n=1 Tax=Klebsiella pneumoniae TaxID=573 RepID=UPI0040559308